MYVEVVNDDDSWSADVVGVEEVFSVAAVVGSLVDKVAIVVDDVLVATDVVDEDVAGRGAVLVVDDEVGSTFVVDSDEV
eukprot:744187-Rhodomonas_salina.1